MIENRIILKEMAITSSLNYKQYYNLLKRRIKCHNEVTKPVIDAVLELEKAKFIKKACEWLYVQLNEGNMECSNMEKFIDNFKKEMEER